MLIPMENTRIQEFITLFLVFQLAHYMTLTKELCNEEHHEVCKPWGTGWRRFFCQHPKNHKGMHQAKAMRWKHSYISPILGKTNVPIK
jgi:hypothetical protein